MEHKPLDGVQIILILLMTFLSGIIFFSIGLIIYLSTVTFRM